jgi:hypothetical protein
VLRKKYHIEQKFRTLLQLTGKMDAEMVEIDQILDDENLLELVEADLSLAFFSCNQNRQKFNSCRSYTTDDSSETLTLPELRKDHQKRK